MHVLEGTSSAFIRQVREPPDIVESDCKPEYRKDEICFVTPVSTWFILIPFENIDRLRKKKYIYANTANPTELITRFIYGESGGASSFWQGRENIFLGVLCNGDTWCSPTNINAGDNKKKILKCVNVGRNIWSERGAEHTNNVLAFSNFPDGRKQHFQGVLRCMCLVLK